MTTGTTFNVKLEKTGRGTWEFTTRGITYVVTAQFGGAQDYSVTAYDNSGKVIAREFAWTLSEARAWIIAFSAAYRVTGDVTISKRIAVVVQYES